MEEVKEDEDEIKDDESLVGASSEEEVVVEQVEPGPAKHREKEPIHNKSPIELLMVLLQLKESPEVNWRRKG